MPRARMEIRGTRHVTGIALTVSLKHDRGGVARELAHAINPDNSRELTERLDAIIRKMNYLNNRELNWVFNEPRTHEFIQAQFTEIDENEQFQAAQAKYTGDYTPEYNGRMPIVVFWRWEFQLPGEIKLTTTAYGRQHDLITLEFEWPSSEKNHAIYKKIWGFTDSFRENTLATAMNTVAGGEFRVTARAQEVIFWGQSPDHLVFGKGQREKLGNRVTQCPGPNRSDPTRYVIRPLEGEKLVVYDNGLDIVGDDRMFYPNGEPVFVSVGPFSLRLCAGQAYTDHIWDRVQVFKDPRLPIKPQTEDEEGGWDEPDGEFIDEEEFDDE